MSQDIKQNLKGFVQTQCKMETIIHAIWDIDANLSVVHYSGISQCNEITLMHFLLELL